MIFRRRTWYLILVLVSLFHPCVSAAQLIGDQVLIEQNTTALGTIRDDLVVVVAATPEITCPNAFELCGANIPGLSQGSFDIEATSVRLDVGTAAGSSSFIVDTFNGYIFSSLDAGLPITGTILSTDIAGLDASRVTFTASSVSVNLSGLIVDPGEFFEVELLFEPTLIGDLVLIEQNRTGLGTIRSDLVFVVEGLPELTCPNGFELCNANIPGLSQGSFDIESSSVRLDVGNAGGTTNFVVDTFNGYIFSDLDAGSPVTGTALSTDIVGLDASRVTFTANSVSVNLSGLTVNPGEFFEVDLEYGHDLAGDLVLIEQNVSTVGTLRDDLVFVATGISEITCPNAFELCGANLPGTNGSIDIESSSITFQIGPNVGTTSFISAAFNGYIFSDLDSGQPITQVSLWTDMPGLDASRVSFTSDSISVNLESLVLDGGQFFTIALPEPVLMLQLIPGILLLAGIGARRRGSRPVARTEQD